MRTLLGINSLSACRQCVSPDDVRIVISGMVDCFKYLLPAISKGLVEILYDRRLEEREVIQGQHFLASINSMPRTLEQRDLRQALFLYLRNHTLAPDTNQTSTVIVTSVDAPESTVSGEISQALFRNCEYWLSLGRTALTEARILQVSCEAVGNVKVRNAYSLESVEMLMPRYEASSKHDRDEYFVDGRKISAMPLSEEEAQKQLLCSVLEGKSRWSFHEPSRRWYRFNKTSDQGDIWHGFVVDTEEVPRSVRRILEHADQ